jgi:replicative DNA helicase
MPSRHLAAVPDTTTYGELNSANIEQIIVGTAMFSPDSIPAMRDHITAESFRDGRMGHIWSVTTEAAQKGQPTHPAAITELLIADGTIARLPTPAFLFETYQMAMPGQGPWYAERLAERHQRHLIEVEAAKLGQAISSPTTSLDTVAEIADRIKEASVPTASSDGTVRLSELADDYVKTYLTWEPSDVTPLPWSDMNKLLTSGGCEPGQLVTFAAASGNGKSIALSDCAREFAVDQQLRVIMFSFEMTKPQLFFRFAAAHTGILETRIKDRNLDPRELAKFGQADAAIKAAPLYVRSGSHSVREAMAETRKAKRSLGGLDVAIFDYGQLFRAEGRAENRQVEVSNNFKAMKDIALDEGLLVLTAAQINRGPQQRTDKRPQLGDLRESAEIENSSDIVILIYRDEHYNKASLNKGVAEFDLAKQRGGPTGTIEVAAQFDRTRFESLAMPA